MIKTRRSERKKQNQKAKPDTRLNPVQSLRRKNSGNGNDFAIKEKRMKEKRSKNYKPSLSV